MAPQNVPWSNKKFLKNHGIIFSSSHGGRYRRYLGQVQVSNSLGEDQCHGGEGSYFLK